VPDLTSHPAAQPAPVDQPAAAVSLRPRKARVVCWIAAVTVVVVFTGVGLALSGPVNSGEAVFGTGDRVAMIALGLLAGTGVLWLTRPRVDADAAGIRVRNLIGDHELPWSVVRAVRFSRSSPWATLELADDDVVAVMAVQATDKDYAVQGVRALRALHAAATGTTAGATGTTAGATGTTAGASGTTAGSAAGTAAGSASAEDRRSE
jgi:hypothetical protein